MNIVFSILPVMIFLAFLFLLDSFKLVRFTTLILCLSWGALCTAAAYALNTLAADWLEINFDFLSRYVAPVVEETLKGSFILFLVSRKKVGFMIDAAIYGFAVGAGFSLVENLYYILTIQQDYNLLIWIIRGFGTAIMQGGCTAILAILLFAGINRSQNAALALIPGLITAILLHSGFNHLLAYPLLLTIFIVVFMPVVFLLIVSRSKDRLQQWLEIEFNSEVELLGMIQKGNFRSTKAGEYLVFVKTRFAPETVVDMYCYIALYLELSIKAKRNVMLRENGFPVIIEPDLQEKMKELGLLRKQIGKVGELALSPLIRMNYRSLWKINQLKG